MKHTAEVQKRPLSRDSAKYESRSVRYKQNQKKKEDNFTLEQS